MSELMNCTRCEICAAAANIYSSLSFVHLSLLFRLIFEPIAVLGVALLTIAVYQTRALHFNARVLLICMTSSVLLCNTGKSGMFAYGSGGAIAVAEDKLVAQILLMHASIFYNNYLIQLLPCNLTWMYTFKYADSPE
ncbi:unnamed protein product [Haemonchus placei]|uniref:TPT domain-containing protein n=1 Tax=Haemonchus placei TaxID=6290 RepID=A0A0N4XAX7_HAEPC|nr:unnamed protein product [Haemonchus placei]